MKKQWLSVLIVGLTLGTAWAVRGQFGHEPGASWAGAIGGLALVLVSQREDWYRKMLLIILASAVGWGAGGMMSYGIVVGYGRSTDFFNASYGLLMLFVIGGLFGLLGGGLVGLTLSSTKDKAVRWGSLAAQMIAGGVIAYALLITKAELYMTPPRHETWAICLGAGLAMLWYMARNNYSSALRVAFITAMGAGFGFAFGNFLQVVGNVLEINFNMWNVMEYSLGFFGGTSMAYAVFSSSWSEESESISPERWENKAAFLILFVLIPFLVIDFSMFLNLVAGQPLSSFEDGNYALAMRLVALALVLVMSLTIWFKVICKKQDYQRKDVLLTFILIFATYILLSYNKKGALKGDFMLNHHLYVINFIVILFLLKKKFSAFFEKSQQINGKKWISLVLLIVVLILVLALIVTNIHGELNGAHNRFLFNIV